MHTYTQSKDCYTSMLREAAGLSGGVAHAKSPTRYDLSD